MTIPGGCNLDLKKKSFKHEKCFCDIEHAKCALTQFHVLNYVLR